MFENFFFRRQKVAKGGSYFVAKSRFTSYKTIDNMCSDLGNFSDCARFVALKFERFLAKSMDQLVLTEYEELAEKLAFSRKFLSV